MNADIIFEEIAFSDLKLVLMELGYFVEVYEKDYFVKLKESDNVVKLYEKGDSLYFECVLEKLEILLDDKDLYRKLLEINPTILPISIGINAQNEQDKRVVIGESLEVENLDENEIISVLDSFEANIPKVRHILNIFKKQK